MLFGRLKKASHNSTLRLVFMYLALFLISSIVLLTFIYWSIVGYMHAQLDQHIEYDRKSLQAIYIKNGQDALVGAINARMAQNSYESIYLLYDEHNKIVAGNLKGIPKQGDSEWGNIVFDSLNDEANTRTARILWTPVAQDLMLLNGLDIESVRKQQHMIFNKLVVGLAIVLFLGALGGYVIGSSIIKKINLINDAIRNVQTGDLSNRIIVKGSDDEYDLLSENINQMLDQTQSLITGMKNISNNIAHDLRTPLTRIRGRLEMIQANCNDDIVQEVALAINDTDSLLSTFNAMLRISKVESGSQKGNFSTIDMYSLLNDVVSLYEPVAQENNIEIHLSSTSEGSVVGDKDMLFQVMANILDNAVKYSPKGGIIKIQLRSLVLTQQRLLEIRIIDSGVGITDKDKIRVFEPFFRAERHRSQEGNGLGLSLVKSILELHKATIELKDNNPGLKVLVRFPNV